MPDERTGPNWGKLKGKAMTFGNRLLFESALVYKYGDIIENLKVWLKPFTPEMVPDMVANNRFPSFPPDVFADIQGWEQYLKLISAERFFQAIADARVDLAEAISKSGQPGMQYIVNLRKYFLEQVSHPEKSLAESTDLPNKIEMVKVTCKSCNKSWPVAKAESEQLKECPFCHSPA